MTHKHTEPQPMPYCPPSLTSSAPSCESPPPYLQSGLRRAARGNCSSSGACHTARSYPSHAQTASPHSSHIWVRRQQNRKHSQAELDVSRGDPPRQARISFEHVWAHVADETHFSSQWSKFVIFFFFVSVNYHRAQWVIIGDMNISSKCSKKAGIMIGTSIRLPATLRQEEVSLTPHQWSVCLHWKNICFIVISTDLSHSATLHYMIKSRSVIHTVVYHYKNRLKKTKERKKCRWTISVLFAFCTSLVNVSILRWIFINP